MAKKTRLGRQTPTRAHILPYKETEGQVAIDLYNETSRTAQPWQELLMYDILAKNDDGLWTHTKFGYSVPRRNGKNEIVVIRELYGLEHGEQMLHTAHLTSTSSAASKRLATLLKERGYEEIIRVRKDVTYKKAFSYSKQFGLERITVLGENGGTCSFRTRTSNGGLGEGFDLLVIDEAQEYQTDQESSLKYTVSDSKNPQTIFCGTPPTAVSKGTVFPKFRLSCLRGEQSNSGWAEWSVDHKSDVHDTELWYECNPAMGFQLNERKVEDEIGEDIIDFNIQRLGLWLTVNQKSVITEKDWLKCELKEMPKLTGKLFVGIKFSKTSDNVAFSFACRTTDGKIFVECFDCRDFRDGNDWIINLLTNADIETAIIDGANGQSVLEKEMKELRFKKYSFPTVKEVIDAYSTFEHGLFDDTLRHKNQPSVFNVVTNTDKRAIGSNGGFGYKSLKENCDITILDSIILAYWACSKAKNTCKQRISY